MAIVYNPAFQHEDWVDNVDRVQAGGDNGFNLRFHALEQEFNQISSVVSNIDTAIAALGQAPPARTVHSSLTPTLVSTAATGWSHGLGFAQKPVGATSAQGMMAVDLPHGATLQAFRATGQNAGPNPGQDGQGDLRLSLRRQGVGPASSSSDLVARVDGTGRSFDVNVPIDTQFATVDGQNFRYFITAQLNNSLANDSVVLLTFQITYLLT